MDVSKDQLLVSTTTRCSGNEPALLNVRKFAVVDISTNQIVVCSNQTGTITYFSWSRFKTAKAKAFFDVACD